jgi:hypothetical protein
MKPLIAGLGTLVLGASLNRVALAQQTHGSRLPAAEETAPSPAYSEEDKSLPPQTLPQTLETEIPVWYEPNRSTPPESQWVYSYPTGQWVYTSDGGWVWIPAGSAPRVVDSVPYVYLYTQQFGWTWYVSPWGWGPFHYGAWVAHPWRPIGWRGGWVARPPVAVRLGDAPVHR